MMLIQPVDLAARRLCDDEGHDHPLLPPNAATGPDGVAAALEAAKRRIRDGWTTYVCWGCGCGGWRPPPGTPR